MHIACKKITPILFFNILLVTCQHAENISDPLHPLISKDKDLSGEFKDSYYQETVQRHTIGKTTTIILGVECKAREVIVFIPSQGSNLMTFPKCRTVMRCTGCCPHPNECCKPKMKSEKNITLALVPSTKDEINNKIQNEITYKNFTLVEHKECHCTKRKSKRNSHGKC